MAAARVAAVRNTALASTNDAVRASLRAARQAGLATNANRPGALGCLPGSPACGPRIAVASRPMPAMAPASAAIQDFGNAVVDKVAAQNPLLAESKIVPREPERDVHLPPPTEMSQSFDSVPSALSASTKKKVRASKSISLQEETMEVVNFLNLINLRIIP